MNNQVLATFEVRGADLVTWNCQNLKVQAGDSKTVFEEVDLTDTWMEYDEETKNNCMIDNFKAAFVRSKKK